MRGRASRTAEFVCLMRAADSTRDDGIRLVDDPYARWFLGPLLRAALATFEASGRLGERSERLAAGLMTFVLTRHRFMDDALGSALASGEVEQLVVLGAGYDTRAFRFAERLDGIPVFELDHPSTAARKSDVLERHADALPEVDRRAVTIDFQTQSIEERLRESGFDTGRRTFWVWEGVSMYLTRDAVKATLGDVRRLGPPGSLLTMDFWYLLDSPDLIAAAHRLSSNFLTLLSEPVTFGIHPEDAGPFLGRLGFETVDLARSDELERRYIDDDRTVYPAIYVALARTVA